MSCNRKYFFLELFVSYFDIKYTYLVSINPFPPSRVGSQKEEVNMKRQP